MNENRQPSVLDRFLRLFADVRAGEGINAVLLAANVFLILTAYYVLKTVRDTIILVESSAEGKAYTSAAQVLLLVFLIPVYARLADRLPRRRLINVVTAFFAGCLPLSYVIVELGIQIGIVFFVWVGIFNVMVVAQFWSFANDIYTKDEGERLFPIVGFGASLGAVAGAAVAGALIAGFDIMNLIWVAAVLLVFEVQITNYVDKNERRRTEAELPDQQTTETLAATGSLRVDDIKKMLEEHEKSEEGQEAEAGAGEQASEDAQESAGEGGGQGAFALVFKTRYLLMMGVLILLLNWVNTTGGYILDRVLLETAQDAIAAGPVAGLSDEEQEEFVTDYIGKFYGAYYAVVSIVSLLMQLFLVSRIVKYLGVAIGIMILPITALGVYSVLAFYPVLNFIRWAKSAENSTDYSLNNTIRNMLFLPTTREQKYKAKQTIDSFFTRAGDLLSAGLVLVGNYIALTASGFAMVNVALVIVWLGLAFLIGREYKRLVATGETPS